MVGLEHDPHNLRQELVDEIQNFCRMIGEMQGEIKELSTSERNVDKELCQFYESKIEEKKKLYAHAKSELKKLEAWQ